MKTQKNIFIFVAVCLMTTVLSGSISHSVAVKQINLAEMASSAKYIFSGK